jgi:hypothetical protein
MTITENLDSNTSYLVTDNLLSLKSLRVHSVYKTLHCIICESVWEPSSMPRHLRTHGISFTRIELAQLEDSCENFQVLSANNVDVPAPRGPPVECLSMVEGGHCCNECNYCAPTFVTFKKHWSTHHPDNHSSARDSFHQGVIQTFFKPHHQHWFEVIPLSIPARDVFEAYVQQQIPQFISTLVPAPVHLRQIPVWISLTGWYDHLKDYILTKPGLEHTRSLVQVPPLKQSQGLGRLRDITFTYMKFIRTIANSSSVGTRRLLIDPSR